MMRPLLLAILPLAGPALADSQSIPPGTLLTPTQIGHAFAAACLGARPAQMQDHAAIVESAFYFEDLGDGQWISPVGDIFVWVTGNPIEASCAISMHPDIVGDGAELYDSLLAHLSEHLDGELPEAEALDSGIIWQFNERDTAYTLDFTMGEAVSITLTGVSD